MQCVRVLPLLNSLAQRNVGRERLAGQPRAAGLESLRSSQDWMAARSYVCPSAVVTGSRMISSVIRQKKAGRRLLACGCSMPPVDDKYFFEVTEILYQRVLNFCTKLFFLFLVVKSKQNFCRVPLTPGNSFDCQLRCRRMAARWRRPCTTTETRQDLALGLL
jgi:hypothetical protein